MAAGLVTPFADGVRITVKVTPKAARTGITGTQAGADGRPLLKVSVNEAAEGGRANDAVVRLLAKCWDVARSDIRIVSGQTHRIKILTVSGDAASLSARILSSGGLAGTDER